MNKILVLLILTVISGCSTVETVKRYWPRAHDPVMFDRLVRLDIEVEKQDCTKPDWVAVAKETQHLARYVQWRSDPQTENLTALHLHVQKLSKGGSKMFCELGKNTARLRIDAAKDAWKAR